MSELMQIAYISKSNLTDDLDVVRKEVADILDVANCKNTKQHITGALLYSGGYFCQVIEGEESHISDLFETIQMDKRHREITVLHFEPLHERGFAKWSMAYAGIEENQRFDIDGIKASKDELQMHETGKQLVNTLAQLVTQHQLIDHSKR